METSKCWSPSSFLFCLEYIMEVILAGACRNAVRIFLQLLSFTNCSIFYWDRITDYFCCWGGNLLTSKHGSPHQLCLLKMFILFVCKHSNVNEIFPSSVLSIWSQKELFYKHAWKPFFLFLWDQHLFILDTLRHFKEILLFSAEIHYYCI